METITLEFDLNTGEAKVEANGFHGKGCKSAMELITKTLGESTDFKKKAEWYETNIKHNLNSNLCG